MVRMLKRWRFEGCQGFSLVEVLVAATLLTIGLLAAAQLFGRCRVTNATADAVTRATILAVEKLEQLRSRSIDDSSLARSPPDALLTSIDAYSDRPVSSYVRRWSVEPLPSFPEDGIVIRVVVTKTGVAGGAFVETIKVRKPTGVTAGEAPD
jgi:prepilin-type N-terminal cleavage/methylation domain-containing protein